MQEPSIHGPSTMIERHTLHPKGQIPLYPVADSPADDATEIQIVVIGLVAEKGSSVCSADRLQGALFAHYRVAAVIRPRPGRRFQEGLSTHS